MIEENLQDSLNEFDITMSEKLGIKLAQSFIDKGARELLARAEKMAFM